MANPHDRCPVLVVEDDPDLRAMMYLLLQTAGFEPTLACDGRDALQRLRAGSTMPDVILLDMMMPTMDGRTFMHEQRRDPALRDIPVVVLTAGTTEGITAAAALVRKPADWDQLVDIIQAQCHSGVTTEPSRPAGQPMPRRV